MAKKNKPIVVAVKEVCPHTGEIVPGQVLGEFRKVKFAEHDAPRLADKARINLVNVGVFSEGVHLEGLQLI
jgi:hypothetical protein